MSVKTVLQVDSVCKQYSTVVAVNNLSFSVQEGEIFALLGPNGAGKTTTVRMLNNIIKPDSGSIQYVIGSSDNGGLFSSLVGYLPEERGLYQEVSIIKTLAFMGIIRGMSRKNAIFAAEKWLEQLGLLDRKQEKLNALSKGNQQKIQFIASIIHSPAFIILDEPFSGFDPINQETFLDIIKDLAAKGGTVLLSAHQMHLVERIADRVLLLHQGRNVAHGTVADIKASTLPGQAVSLQFEDDITIAALLENASIARAEQVNDRHIKVILKSPRDLSPFLQSISAAHKLTSVSTEQISLHDAFIEIIKNTTEAYNAE